MPASNRLMLESQSALSLLTIVEFPVHSSKQEGCQRVLFINEKAGYEHNLR